MWTQSNHYSNLINCKASYVLLVCSWKIRIVGLLMSFLWYSLILFVNYSRNECNKVTILYSFMCTNKGITCQFYWSLNEAWRKRKKKLLWNAGNMKFLCILFVFLCFWLFRKIIFTTIFRQYSWQRIAKRFLSEYSKILEHLIILSWFIFF